MTEASYTAWDDKQYVWPPPDGWYEASDSKWWPQGYGPPQVKEEPPTTAAVEPHQAAQEPQANEVSVEASLFEVSSSDVLGDSDWQAPVNAEAVVENQMAEASDVADQGISASVSEQAVTNVLPVDGLTTDGLTTDGLSTSGLVGGFSSESTGWVTDVPNQQDAADDIDAAATSLDEQADEGVADAATTVGDGANGFAGSVSQAAEAVDAAETTLIGEADSLTESVDQAVVEPSQTVADTSQTVVDGEALDTSSAARDAFGTGLMPPMADRAAPATENGETPPPFDTPLTAEHQDPVDPSPQTTADLSAFSAAPATAQPPMDDPVEQQAITASTGKGSSRGLLFAILGVLILVAVGAALFFALGGDGDSAAETDESVTPGPGSVDQPHPRATGVVVFYPDDGIEQRWIIEVLEPVRDATEELGSAGGGEMFAATRIRVSNDTGTDVAEVEDLRFNLVDASNTVVIRTDNSCPAAADDLNYSASVAMNSSVEGTVCWAIPSGDLAGLKLGIESSKVQGRVHIQLQ